MYRAQANVCFFSSLVTSNSRLCGGLDTLTLFKSVSRMNPPQIRIPKIIQSPRLYEATLKLYEAISISI